jgi:hypothetical protein
MHQSIDAINFCCCRLARLFLCAAQYYPPRHEIEKINGGKKDVTLRSLRAIADACPDLENLASISKAAALRVS